MLDYLIISEVKWKQQLTKGSISANLEQQTLSENRVTEKLKTII